jgi:hypothetical protein
MKYRVTFKDGTHNNVEADNYVDAKYKALIIRDDKHILSNIINIVSCEEAPPELPDQWPTCNCDPD